MEIASGSKDPAENSLCKGPGAGMCQLCLRKGSYLCNVPVQGGWSEAVGKIGGRTG